MRGSYRPPDRHDVCALYGPPRTIEPLWGRIQVWSYGRGTGLMNTDSGPRGRFRFSHSRGIVVFDGNAAVAFRFKTSGRRRTPIGG